MKIFKDMMSHEVCCSVAVCGLVMSQLRLRTGFISNKPAGSFIQSRMKLQ